MAISRLGLSSSEFYELSPAEFYVALADWQEQQQLIVDVAETQVRSMWETTRLAMMTQINSNPYRKNTVLSAKDLFPLPWDSEAAEAPVKQQSLEEMKRAIMGIHEFMQKQKKR